MPRSPAASPGGRARKAAAPARSAPARSSAARAAPVAPAPSPRSARSTRSAPATRAGSKGVDLETYVPAYFTWIANKLSSGASRAYLSTFDVGIEVWRLLVSLAIEPALTASQICEVIGMDKASVSRALKQMQARGLVTFALDPDDGRLRVASITAKGRRLHDQIAAIALERQKALLSVLDSTERAALIRLLHKLHDNLGTVEVATERYLASHYPKSRSPRKRTTRAAGA